MFEEKMLGRSHHQFIKSHHWLDRPEIVRYYCEMHVSDANSDTGQAIYAVLINKLH